MRRHAMAMVASCALVIGCAPSLHIDPTLDCDGGVCHVVGDDGGVAAQAVTCTPNQKFCADNHVATCTLSGHDAVVGEDCAASGTPTNASSCTSNGCPAGQQACCKKQDPICAWNVTSPFTDKGSAYVFSGAAFCSVSAGCPGDPGLVVSWNENGSMCPRSSRLIQVNIDRTKLAAGSSTALPLTGVSVLLNDVEPGMPTISCSAWTGNFRFDSDAPAWSVTIDATCSEAGKTSLRLTGTISGQL